MIDKSILKRPETLSYEKVDLLTKASRKGPGNLEKDSLRICSRRKPVTICEPYLT